MLPSPVFATLTVAELAPAAFAVAVELLLLLPQPAATSATSGTSTAAERRPRGLLRVMLAPLRSDDMRVATHARRERRAFRRRLGGSFGCYGRGAPARARRLAAVGATSAPRLTTTAPAER